MKKISMLLSLALAIAACSTDNTPDGGNDSGKVRLSFRALTPGTKVVTGTGDMTLNHYQVFVFDASGDLEANSGLIDGTEQGLPSLELSPGRKNIWAVGNANRDLTTAYGVSTEEEFLGIRLYLEEQVNGQGLFYSAKILNRVVNEDYTVDLEFDHMPCKVVIDKIEKNFSDPDLAQVPMYIKRIYLSNVAADCNFDCSGTPEEWYNKKGIIDFEEDIVHYEFASPGYGLAQGGQYNHSHVFYTFPHPVKSDTYGGNGWAPRRTRLVVECSFNGEPCYYPITLPNDPNAVLARNTVYHISKLVLKRPGSPDPDDPGNEIDPYMEYSFEVIVHDWIEGDSYSETFE